VSRPNSVIQDRSIYEDAEIFAENLYRQGYMSERDYRTYREVYGALLPFLPPPDLVVYLRASVPTLQARIALRGRDYERNIPHEYLEQLNRLYESWIEGFTLCPVLTVPADTLDFVRHNSHLELITTRVMEKLQGQEVVVFDQ
jgi:deoxyadenosine/deoxycytidine kinase